VYGLITAIRWNACVCVVRAYACARMQMQWSRAEAQKATAPAGRSSSRRQADHETGIEESTRHSDRCHHGRVMLLLTTYSFNSGQRQPAPAAALMLTVLADRSVSSLLSCLPRLKAFQKFGSGI